MVAQLRDEDPIARLFVNDPMLRSDSTRPVALQRVLQWLGLADAGVRITHNLFDQKVDSRNHLRIGLLPVKIIRPRLAVRRRIHAPSLILRLSPLPLRSRLRCWLRPARHTTSDRMAAHRKLDRRRDDLCGPGFGNVL
jgi:hypothetical protein